jgi:peptide deformylase
MNLRIPVPAKSIANVGGSSNARMPLLHRGDGSWNLPLSTIHQRSTKLYKKPAHTLISRMVNTMNKHGGVGLAATQIGEPVRLIVVHIPCEPLYVLCNPVIVKQSGSIDSVEGCLSSPYTVTIKRYEDIEVHAQDRNLRPLTIHATGYFACILQHEIDHLDGILITEALA